MLLLTAASIKLFLGISVYNPTGAMYKVSKWMLKWWKFICSDSVILQERSALHGIRNESGIFYLLNKDCAPWIAPTRPSVLIPKTIHSSNRHPAHFHQGQGPGPSSSPLLLGAVTSSGQPPRVPHNTLGKRGLSGTECGANILQINIIV